MTDYKTSDIPNDIQRVYRELGIASERERKRFTELPEVEPCFQWQIEPTGPIITRTNTRFDPEDVGASHELAASGDTAPR